MPLLREELAQFVLDKNAYPIRRQPNRIGHVPGVPNELYYQEGRRYGFPVNEQLLLQWEAYLTSFGRDISSPLPLLTNLDFNIYLTAETTAWCEQVMSQIGHPAPVTASEFFVVGGHIIPDWYQHLVYRARAYASSGCLPILALAPRPFVDYRKEIVAEICQAMNLDRAVWPILREEE
jgi:hypothetical protein